MKKFTYYDLLKVSPTANHDEIRDAYHAAILKHHPDVNISSDAHYFTILLNQAYEILGDKELRKKYDILLLHVNNDLVSLFFEWNNLIISWFVWPKGH